MSLEVGSFALDGPIVLAGAGKMGDGPSVGLARRVG